MCGIAGIITAAQVTRDEVERLITPIEHRGPDDSGVWVDAERGVGLGHRRLAIVDLSPAGHQPMVSQSGRYVLTFNGEIYNHLELKRSLEEEGGQPDEGWRGHSDTEVLLQGLVHWGLNKTLQRSVGMFAFGLWDRQQQQLFLVRDRFGEKPLYYGRIAGDFVFGSELKAIRAHPKFGAEIDREALRLFAARTYIPAPRTIYRGIYKLEPGCILSLGRGDDEPAIRRYWSYREVVEGGLASPIIDESEAACELDRVLGRAINEQGVADVPVGAFLSGGVDSSAVVALYQRHSALPVRTFTIGFEEDSFNEADHARAVAKHLRTVHHEQVVTAEHARDVIPLLPTIYDEPFADSSQIPTFLVSQFARSKVTVALTGDGADELFAGYNRHLTTPKLWAGLNRVPMPLRQLASPFGRVPAPVLAPAERLLLRHGANQDGTKLQRALRMAGRVGSIDDVYSGLLDAWYDGPSPVLGAFASDPFDLDVKAPDTLRLMYSDAQSYLPDDILCKVDRASMAVSLETRVPFLDHRVAELAARIPLEQKVRAGRGKHILRELLYRHVPREVIDRPKAGFAVPIGKWIKGPLRGWAEELLDRKRLSEEGFFDAAMVRSRWRDHLDGSRESTAALWAVLMFQAWHSAQI